MASKTLKIKRIFAWAIYNSLKAVAPKDYPTTGEIKSTITDVLPALRAHVDEYVEKMAAVVALNEKVVAKQLTDAEAKAAVEKINMEFREYNKQQGVELVDVTLDDDGFKTLKAQFEREGWGKQWLANIEEFGELLAAFEAASK